MRKLSAMLPAVALVSALGMPAFGAEATVRGEVVDLQCHTRKGDAGRGEGHKGCATACAKKGAAMAILTADGKAYQITGDYTANNNAKLLDFIAARVEATGEVSEAGGQPTINVTAVKAAR